METITREEAVDISRGAAELIFEVVKRHVPDADTLANIAEDIIALNREGKGAVEASDDAGRNG